MDYITAIPVAIALVVVAVIAVLIPMLFRVVVSTNDVHIVQSAKTTVSYGKDQPAGNTYYSWPAWVPIIGIKVINLPVSVFSLDIKDYEAYDKDRVPFIIHVLAFFRIEEPNIAAQRVHSFKELQEQLLGILQGASRSILAKSHINEILEERAKYGGMFTDAVEDQLKAWGVGNVKTIELMDLRDAKDSKVISNIMAKKQSHIEMESRVEVAKNKQAAQEAEINADRAVKVRTQEAEQAIGERTAEKHRQVGIADEQAKQRIKEQEKITAEKTMAVAQVNQVKQAEITKEVHVVEAEQQKQTDIIKAEGEKQQVTLIAEGNLEKAKRNAEGIRAEGDAKGAAEQAMLMAPVNAQITLAEKIDKSAGYQDYLVRIRNVEKEEKVGVANAEALMDADIKVIANGGDITGGLSSIGDIMTAKGGTQAASAIEAFIQSDAGKAILTRFGIKLPEKSST